MILEQVPYELLNKKFRAVQKALDREVVQINSTSADLTQSKSSGVTMSSVSGILSHMEQKITSLKRKAEESLEEEIEYAQLCKKRIDHLKSYISGQILTCMFPKFGNLVHCWYYLVCHEQ